MYIAINKTNPNDFHSFHWTQDDKLIINDHQVDPDGWDIIEVHAAAEIMVYGIDANEYDGSIYDLTDDQFQEEAESQHLVWSLKSFQEGFNEGYVSSNNLFIRFITKK